MIRAIIVTLLVACSLGASAQFRGKHNRIVGGADTKIEYHPFQVSLIHQRGDHNCGGSLIARNWVLTAAHCISYFKYTVRVGSTIVDKGGKVYTVKNQHVHPKFSNQEYDFALLELNEPVTLSDKVQVIKLVDSGVELRDGTMVNVTGWGETLKQYTDVLQLVTVPTINQAKCDAAYANYGGVTDTMFCAGYLGVGGKDACQGDSGGPVVANGIQYGIVSWGAGCAEPQYPGVYSKISVERDWIRKVSGV